LVAGVPVVAQSGRATLTGTVTDTNGAVIPGAAITLKETQTGSSYDSKSGPEGLFTFTELSPGNYALEVNAAGFEASGRSASTCSLAALPPSTLS